VAGSIRVIISSFTDRIVIAILEDGAERLRPEKKRNQCCAKYEQYNLIEAGEECKRFFALQA
jgi:hypothetical protein